MRQDKRWPIMSISVVTGAAQSRRIMGRVFNEWAREIAAIRRLASRQPAGSGGTED